MVSRLSFSSKLRQIRAGKESVGDKTKSRWRGVNNREGNKLNTVHVQVNETVFQLCGDESEFIARDEFQLISVIISTRRR